jgi:hypothetical protein
VLFTLTVVTLCVAQILLLAKHWTRVTVRDRGTARLRQMRRGLDWGRSGPRSRIAAGVSRFGELRGQ